MRNSIKTGLSFGLTSGVITTLGLLVGLAAGTDSRMVVLGAIFTIALADSLSDAMGIHISEESREHQTRTAIWEATIVTFVAKALVSLSFIPAVLLLPLDQAIMVSILWGLLLVSVLSFWVAVLNHASPIRAIGEHVFITLTVVLATRQLGLWVGSHFGS